MTEAARQTAAILQAIIANDDAGLGDLRWARDRDQASSGLDPRTFAAARLAAVIAIGGSEASLRWQVERALTALLTPEDIVGVLTAIAPQVGYPRIVAAAPIVQAALGIEAGDGD